MNKIIVSAVKTIFIIACFIAMVWGMLFIVSRIDQRF